jgi:hypothetical protein
MWRQHKVIIIFAVIVVIAYGGHMLYRYLKIRADSATREAFVVFPTLVESNCNRWVSRGTKNTVSTLSNRRAGKWHSFVEHNISDRDRSESLPRLGARLLFLLFGPSVDGWTVWNRIG